MKKSKTMRLAAMLLVAVMLTTCAISGTFAKYVTADSATDSARVAKWGVEITTTADSAFAETYATKGTVNDKNGDAIANSVVAENLVVAPGTSGNGLANFGVSGTPEVAVNVNIAVEDVSDVVLMAKDGYADYTTGDTADTFNLAAAYYPIVYTLTKSGGSSVEYTSLAAVEAALEALSGNYPAGTDLGSVIGSYTLSWAWAFDGNDKADTYLGNVASGLITDSNANTAINFEIFITITQID